MFLHIFYTIAFLSQAEEIEIEKLSLTWNGNCKNCLMSVMNSNGSFIELENFLPIFTGNCINCSIKLVNNFDYLTFLQENSHRFKIITHILLVCLIFHFSGLFTQFTTFIGSIVTFNHHAKNSVRLDNLRKYHNARCVKHNLRLPQSSSCETENSV